MEQLLQVGVITQTHGVHGEVKVFPTTDDPERFLDLEYVFLEQRTVKAFGIWNRFVHLEFFRLDGDREGLGKKGDFVALEVNMRPAGGYTPDMINFAHSTDVYKIWADMVAFGESRTQQGHQQYCAFASRRDIYHYVHSHEEVLSRYGDRIVMCERMPELFSAAMGQQMYTVKLQTMEEVNDFVKFVHDKKQ